MSKAYPGLVVGAVVLTFHGLVLALLLTVQAIATIPEPLPFVVVDHRQTQSQLRLHRTGHKRKIRVQGIPYPSGLGTLGNAVTTIRFPEGGGVFSGRCGTPDYAINAIVRCRIRTLNESGGLSELFSSYELQRSGPSQPFSVAVPPSGQLQLVVESLNDPKVDSAVWVDFAYQGEQP